MIRALAFARQLSADPVDVARVIILVACAVALIAAGQALPF